MVEIIAIKAGEATLRFYIKFDAAAVRIIIRLLNADGWSVTTDL